MKSKVTLCISNCDLDGLQSVFKTLSSSAVTRLELGGPSGQQRDRIFMSSGSIIKGFNRRGKQFLDFNTNTTEPVCSLYDGILLFDSCLP